jgi:Fur family ferric uptake transcriptional regulator
MNYLQESRTAPAWFSRLQASGYRLTTARRAVVDVIASSERVLTATQVFDQARRQCDSLGLVTVYRTLAKLEELSLVERVHQPQDCHAYIAASADHQHLLICENCGRAQFFSGDRLEPLMNEVSKTSGYQIAEHWLQLFGTCQECQRIDQGKEKANRDGPTG